MNRKQRRKLARIKRRKYGADGKLSARSSLQRLRERAAQAAWRMREARRA